MAKYCIGDLHGREDLFFSLLEKICFNPEKDILYVLGDVIDGSYGGVKIIKFLQSKNASCILLRGNHEEHFLNMRSAYDTFMLKQTLKKQMKDVIEVYSENLYEKIENEFLSQTKRIGIASLETIRIKKWIESGNVQVRKKLLVCIANFLESIEYNQQIYKEARCIWRNLRGRYNTKEFVREMFEQTEEDYKLIVDYLDRTPRKLSFKIEGKDVVLVHSIQHIVENRIFSPSIMFPHAETKNVTYIFGHEPVPKIHKYVSKADRYCGFLFDYRRLFAYCDDKNNNYYNLDLGSNPVVALCLDNMNEYYVGIPSKRKNAQEWIVPIDEIGRIKTKEVKSVQKINFFDRATQRNIIIEDGVKNNRAYVTYKDGGYEFLIGIHFSKKKIYYTRVDLLDYHYAFIIDDWFCNQSIEQIVNKVTDDFSLRLRSNELEWVYSVLYGQSYN